ncbi:hypothetical protein SDC9_165192 [bioreactor metagenome]|uniref:Uncharacterized protein n=1 Tax=bioreactor metagenome TaxID=1076179 RepID=A0A645FTN5_9ZZZZ
MGVHIAVTVKVNIGIGRMVQLFVECGKVFKCKVRNIFRVAARLLTIDRIWIKGLEDFTLQHFLGA